MEGFPSLTTDIGIPNNDAKLPEIVPGERFLSSFEPGMGLLVTWSPIVSAIDEEHSMVYEGGFLRIDSA
ncbi:unnamed protein product [Tilletia laevis]|nr:unnamed protein product [Tilletia laevis]